MIKQSRPLVVRIPDLALTPQLQQIVDSAAEDFEMIAVNPAGIFYRSHSTGQSTGHHATDK